MVWYTASSPPLGFLVPGRLAAHDSPLNLRGSTSWHRQRPTLFVPTIAVRFDQTAKSTSGSAFPSIPLSFGLATILPPEPKNSRFLMRSERINLFRRIKMVSTSDSRLVSFIVGTTTVSNHLRSPNFNPSSIGLWWLSTAFASARLTRIIGFHPYPCDSWNLTLNLIVNTVFSPTRRENTVHDAIPCSIVQAILWHSLLEAQRFIHGCPPSFGAFFPEKKGSNPLYSNRLPLLSESFSHLILLNHGFKIDQNLCNITLILQKN